MAKQITPTEAGESMLTFLLDKGLKGDPKALESLEAILNSAKSPEKVFEKFGVRIEKESKS